MPNDPRENMARATLDAIQKRVQVARQRHDYDSIRVDLLAIVQYIERQLKRIEQFTVVKQNHQGENVWQYEGEVLEWSATHVKLLAYFNRSTYVTDYHTFKEGDKFIEWFFTDRWYNIFALYDADDGHFKGWYCNITRPATLEAGRVIHQDLALDVMVYPDYTYRILDEEEFAALDIDDATRTQARRALQDLLVLIESRQGIFQDGGGGAP